MGRTIINIFEMGELIRAGKKTSQIAQHFGVTDRAVQKKAKELGLNITKNAALHQAKRILSQDLDARGQLLKINDSANRILDLLEEQLAQDQEAGVARLVYRLEGLKTKLKGEGEGGGEVIADLKLLVITRPATIEQLFKGQAGLRRHTGW